MATTLLTAREVVRRLTRAGASERSARRVVAAGLVGPPQRTTSALLYDEAALEALLDRRVWSTTDVRQAVAAYWRTQGVPAGEVLLIRRDVPVGGDREAIHAALSSGWRMAVLTAIYLNSRPSQGERVAVIATTGGFVTAGCDVVGVHSYRRDRARVELEAPGGWFDEDLANAYVPTGPGAEWMMLGRGWGRDRDDSRSGPGGPRVAS